MTVRRVAPRDGATVRSASGRARHARMRGILAERPMLPPAMLRSSSARAAASRAPLAGVAAARRRAAARARTMRALRAARATLAHARAGRRFRRAAPARHAAASAVPRAAGRGTDGARRGRRRPRGALFLRADRLEGDAADDHRRRAASSCARATRRCSPTGSITTSQRTRSGRRATSCCARASTGSPDPSSSSSATPRSAASPSPRFFVAEANAHGDRASEIRFAGPDQYEVSDARYTTCVAPHHDWYLRSEELEVDTVAQGGAPRTTRRVYFMDVPIDLLAVARVSAVERAQVGLPHADARLDAACAASKSRRRTTSTSRRTTTRR